MRSQFTYLRQKIEAFRRTIGGLIKYRNVLLYQVIQENPLRYYSRKVKPSIVTQQLKKNGHKHQLVSTLSINHPTFSEIKPVLYRLSLAIMPQLWYHVCTHQAILVSNHLVPKILALNREKGLNADVYEVPTKSFISLYILDYVTVEI